MAIMANLRNAGPAPAGPKLSDLEGQVLVLSPTAITDEPTQNNPTKTHKAVECVVLVWDKKAKELKGWDYESSKVHWRRVVGQLTTEDAEGNIVPVSEDVVGKLTKDGNAFVLADVTDATLEAIGKQMDAF